MAKKYGFKLKFTEKKGGYLKPIEEELEKNVL